MIIDYYSKGIYFNLSKDFIYPFDNNLTVNLYFQIAYRLVAGMMLSLGTSFTGPGKSLKKVGFFIVSTSSLGSILCQAAKDFAPFES